MFFKIVKKDKNLILDINTAELLFVPGFYSINVWFGFGHTHTLYKINNFFNFNLEQGNYTKRLKALPNHSKVYLHSKWKNNIKYD